MTSAACHDGHLLPEVVTKDNTSAEVWADKAYRSVENEAFLQQNDLDSRIHRKKPRGKTMPKPSHEAMEHVLRCVALSNTSLLNRSIGCY